jgi:hypothetical protein
MGVTCAGRYRAVAPTDRRVSLFANRFFKMMLMRRGEVAMAQSGNINSNTNLTLREGHSGAGG